jgi:Lipocalin-like domain
MRLIVATAFIGLTYAAPVYAQAIDIVGTYRLISEERTIVATGEVIPTRNPKGYITYTREGRMVALIVRNCCAGAANDHPAAAAPLSSVMNSRRNWAGGVREAYQRGNAADLLQGSYTRRQEQAFACRPG